MRVVVDYSPQSVFRGSAAPPPGSTRGERVVVLRPGRDAAANPGARYETTDEARQLDRSVRAHERTHQAALGAYAASGVQLTTRTGADGERIAVGGRIKADLTPVPGDPRATMRKANAVRRAALAVGSPSAADMRVAAEAYRLARDASDELEAQRLDTSA
ncbi:MAG: putative metalloprotease CJM1_0395 family protein [Spirochaetota bacterium]